MAVGSCPEDIEVFLRGKNAHPNPLRDAAEKACTCRDFNLRGAVVQNRVPLYRCGVLQTAQRVSLLTVNVE